MTNGESFFQQHIKAVRGNGDCPFSPNLPGGMDVWVVGQKQYCTADEAYVAATEGVQVTAKAQGLGNAILGGAGGFLSDIPAMTESWWFRASVRYSRLT